MRLTFLAGALERWFTVVIKIDATISMPIFPRLGSVIGTHNFYELWPIAAFIPNFISKIPHFLTNKAGPQVALISLTSW